MKVLHVINSLGGSGGAEHGLVREITRFSSDVDQKVVRLFPKDHLDRQLEEAGIDVISLDLGSENAGWKLPSAVSRLNSVIRRERPDVVHSSLFTSNLVAQASARLRGVPIVSTFTLSGEADLLTRYQPGADSMRAATLRRLAAYTARGKRVWFRALTSDALETNCALLGVDPGRATVIPRGVPADLAPSSLRSREDLGLPANGTILVNVGRQTAQKGHLSLFEAFEDVRREVDDAHLVIVGREGEATPEINAAISAAGLGDHVTLTGYTPDVHHYVSHASVFVFSSYMEGLGTAVLEALALGLPVVAYDIPPVREISDDGALATLVPIGDSKALAEAVVATLDSADDERDSRQRLVLDRYSVEGVAQRLEELLRKVSI